MQARRPEIEQAVLTRVCAVPDPTEIIDPEYLEGLRAAVSTAIDYGLTAIELGEERSPPMPAALLAQARLAARSGVSLDTVLRRCIAGNTAFVDSLIDAAEDLPREATIQLLRTQAATFERLVTAVLDEYTRESESLTSA